MKAQLLIAPHEVLVIAPKILMGHQAGASKDNLQEQVTDESPKKAKDYFLYKRHILNTLNGGGYMLLLSMIRYGWMTGLEPATTRTTIWRSTS